MNILLQILLDGLFAAIAAVGFAAISRPPKRAYVFCALIAAVGHATRYVLMNPQCGVEMNIIVATFIASFLIGVLAVFLSREAHTPAETCLFPSLLPMIPGMYAYRAFGGLAMSVISKSREAFDSYFYLFSSNALTCGCILLGMVIGATLPIFIFQGISFTATRRD